VRRSARGGNPDMSRTLPKAEADPKRTFSRGERPKISNQQAAVEIRHISKDYFACTNCFVTSRAHSTKRSTRLKVRFFRVAIPTGHGRAGKSTGSTFSADHPISSRATPGLIRKVSRPISSWHLDGGLPALTLSCGARLSQTRGPMGRGAHKDPAPC
jgi:hypothetical protein